MTDWAAFFDALADFAIIVFALVCFYKFLFGEDLKCYWFLLCVWLCQSLQRTFTIFT